LSTSRRALPRGRFVVLEGLDGAGTTTQTAELTRRLTVRGLRVLATAEPSRGPIGTLARLAISRRLRGGDGKDLDRGALSLLFAADRLDHAQAEIVPALVSGRWVVSDRYALSSLAYQTLDLPERFVAQINARAPRPDLTILLELPPELAVKRRRAAKPEADLFEELATQRRVAKNYRRYVEPREGLPDLGPIVRLDAAQPIVAVAEQIERLVVARFKL
jgi:dTMP kinase